ncbi:site-specific integrase [Actinomadura madurae]|uniref:site-specific integrase n=1 Tax=Actinomadura madurae TaxID=1993 RepID=UPI00399A337C
MTSGSSAAAPAAVKAAPSTVSRSDAAERAASSRRRWKWSRRFNASGERCGSSGPKTDDSKRTVPLPDRCITALCEHQVRQDAERADAWPNWQNSGLDFPFRLGTPMEPDNLRRSRGRIRETAGLESMRFHDMRHICVSLLLALGIPPHIVRDIVGHSDIEVTMTIYAHAAPDEKRAALGKLGDALG